MLPLLLLTMSIAVELPRPPLHVHMHITSNSSQHVTVTLPSAFQPTALALFKPCLHCLLSHSITTCPPKLLSGKDRAVSSSVSPNLESKSLQRGTDISEGYHKLTLGC